MLIPLGAGALAALCLWFSWRALQGCRAIEQGARSPGDAAEPNENDELELALLACERNLQLGLAKRNVQALGRAALFGGTGLSFLAFSGGGEYDLVRLLPALLAFGSGMLGWAGCAEIQRRVGYLADRWRGANANANAKNRRRRQGVDPSERTG